MSRIFFSILVLFVLSELAYFVIESLSCWTPDDMSRELHQVSLRLTKWRTGRKVEGVCKKLQHYFLKTILCEVSFHCVLQAEPKVTSWS